MEIMNLQEFYKREENESGDISLYLTYLERIKKELKERLDDVLALSLSDSVASEVRNQINIVEALERTINKGLKELMILSVDSLNDEELKLLGSNYLSICLKKRRQLHEQLDAKKNAKELAEETKKDNYYKLGYKDEFYEVKDTEVFFRDIIPARDYVKNLIKSDMDKVNLAKFFSLMFKSDTDSNILANMIIKLRKIYEVTKSDETLNEIVDSFLSLNGIGKVIDTTSYEYCSYIFEDLQKQEKLNTDFFKALPVSLQKSITDEDFDINGMYGSLSKVYLEYKNNGSVKMPETFDDNELEESIRNLEKQVLAIDKDIETLEANDVEALIKFIKNSIRTNEEDSLATEVIGKYIGGFKAIVEYLSNRYEELKEKEFDLNLYSSCIEGFLENPNNIELDIVKAYRDLLVFDDLADEATEKLVFSYFDVERRRLKQYEILLTTIFKLNNLKEQIDTISNSRNIVKNLFGANEREKNKLMEEYQKICQDCYNELESPGLLRVIVNDSDLEEQSQVLAKPLNFEEIFNGVTTHRYQVTNEEFVELRMRVMLPYRMWCLENLNDFFRVNASYNERIFSLCKREDGLYDFSIGDSSNDALIIQSKIVDIFEELYYSYKKETLAKKLVEKREEISETQSELEAIKVLLNVIDSLSEEATVEEDVQAVNETNLSDLSTDELMNIALKLL